MRDEFIPLDVFFRPPRNELDSTTIASAPSDATPPSLQPEIPSLEETLSEIRRFRAALADARDAALQPLLKAIAHDVLGRELALKPAVIANVIARAVGRTALDDVVTMRVHSLDLAGAQQLGLPIQSDDELQRGDVVIELRSGTIDMRLQKRLDAVLAACGV